MSLFWLFDSPIKPQQPWPRCRRCGALLNPQHNVGRLCQECIAALRRPGPGGF